MSCSEWREAKLGDVYEISSGLSKNSKEFGFGSSFLSFKTVFNNYFVPDKLTDLVNSSPIEQEKYSVKRGDVFLTRTSEVLDELGMSCVALKDYDNATFNGFTKRLRLLTIDSVVPEYAGYYFRSKNFRDELVSMSTISTRASLNNDILNRLKVVLPPLPEQKALAATLCCLDDKIELNNRMNKNLEEMAQAIFNSWFVDFEPFQDGEFEDSELGMIPKGWRVERLGDVCKCILGGTPSRKNQEYWNGNIPWINSGKVNEFRIIEASEYITDKGLAKSATTLLPIKTTVLAITGATLGQVSLLEISSCANQSVVGILENELLPYEFIYPMICNQIQEIINHQTGGAQQHINKGNVEGEKLIIPSQKAISKYKALVSGIYQIIAKNCFENKKLQEARDLLLPKLLSGEIRVPIEEVQ